MVQHCYMKFCGNFYLSIASVKVVNNIQMKRDKLNVSERNVCLMIPGKIKYSIKYRKWAAKWSYNCFSLQSMIGQHLYKYQVATQFLFSSQTRSTENSIFEKVISSRNFYTCREREGEERERANE